MKKNIYIFLNNKLVTIDSVLPTIILIKNKFEAMNITFYVFNKKTFEEINKNILLIKLVNDLGEIKIFGNNQNTKFRILRLLKIILNLLYLIINNFFSKNTYIHFKALETFPFNILYYTNKKNCFYFEPNCWGYSDNLEKSYNIFFKRDINYKTKISLKCFDHLVSYSKESPLVEHARTLNKNIYFLNPSRSATHWLAFCKKEARKFLNHNVELVKIKKKKIMVLYLIGTFDMVSGLDERTNGYKLFIETIKILKSKKSIHIIFKPHPAADSIKMKKILKNLDFKNYTISYMHTSVLAKICKFSICNYFSFTLADAWFAGSNVIEITKYDKLMLKLTNGNSIYPEFVDYFLDINNKKKMLEILKKNRYQKKGFIKKRFRRNLN